MTVGHRYTYRQPRSRHDGETVIVMSEGGGVAMVREIRGEWLGQPYVVRSECLEPQPMAYFHGAVPKEVACK